MHVYGNKERPILLAETGGISTKAGRLYWRLQRWIGELAAAIGVCVELTDNLKIHEREERFADQL